MSGDAPAGRPPAGGGGGGPAGGRANENKRRRLDEINRRIFKINRRILDNAVDQKPYETTGNEFGEWDGTYNQPGQSGGESKRDETDYISDIPYEDEEDDFEDLYYILKALDEKERQKPRYKQRAKMAKKLRKQGATARTGKRRPNPKPHKKKPVLGLTKLRF